MAGGKLDPYSDDLGGDLPVPMPGPTEAVDYDDDAEYTEEQISEGRRDRALQVALEHCKHTGNSELLDVARQVEAFLKGD